MAERERHLQGVLRECVREGVRGAADPWPAIRDRVGERADGRAMVAPRRPRRRSPSPLRRPRWVLATLAALLVFGTGAYATGGIMDVLDYLFEDTVPYVQKHELGTPVEEKIARDGAIVIIDRVYADQHYVVVGFHVDGLDELGDGPNDPHDDLLADAWLSEAGAQGDAAGARRFAMTDGYWRGWAPPGEEEAGPYMPRPPKGSQVGTVVFQSPAELAPGEHRFRVEVGLFRGGSQEPVVRPFVFDLEARVRPAPTIEVNRTVERNGVPITLTRVVNSPVKTHAFLCFDPPEGEYDWPAVKTGFLGLGGGHLADVPVNHPDDDVGGAAQEGCATYNFGKTLYDKPGTHSLTVTELHADDPEVRGSVKGPWRFRFEVPKP